jgi:hypothetical protein
MEAQEVTLPKLQVSIEVVKPVEAFCVYQGAQPKFSSEDVNLCHAVANRLKADAIVCGIDVRDSEHIISVRSL